MATIVALLLVAYSSWIIIFSLDTMVGLRILVCFCSRC